MTLGLGRASLVRIPTNDRFEMRRRRARGGDRGRPRRRAAGRSRSSPRVGTTSSTSVDPVAAIADVAAREGLWLHVDAAYAGAVAIDPGPASPVRGAGSGRIRSSSTRTSGSGRRSMRRCS